MRRYWFWLLVLFGVVLSGAFLRWQTLPTGDPVTINGLTVPPMPTLNADWVSQGETLYAQNCASCHGANLEGALEWKTVKPDGKLLPPHDSSGHTWHHPDNLLLSIIVEGGDPSNSDMPAYGDILTGEETIAILTFIKNSWGPEEREFQWWITAKEQ